ncbi:hypothetical protein TNCV_833151 [Trichonephila clavipes]|uniref:Uncharacterized protein n=1 Tax=Trichonephila clavipes TaxID=2585209 RepID=A0A8X6R5W2_TRICX|nr:hypothetical protein TNCV_833151 [Trichonephila clavipes]
MGQQFPSNVGGKAAVLNWFRRHCCRPSAADKGWQVYPLDPRPDSVVLYSGCTPDKRRAWVFPDDRHTSSLDGLRGGWRYARMKFSACLWIQVGCARVKVSFYPAST